MGDHDELVEATIAALREHRSCDLQDRALAGLCAQSVLDAVVPLIAAQATADLRRRVEAVLVADEQWDGGPDTVGPLCRALSSLRDGTSVVRRT